MPNPFLDDEDETDQPGLENQNFKQLRDYAKKLERQANSAGKELETLRQFKAEVEAERRSQSVASVFEKVGLSRKHAALFAKLNPDGDVTEDLVVQFATEYELPRSEAPASETPANPDHPEHWPVDGEIAEITPAEASPVTNAGFAPTAASTQVPAGSFITSAEEAINLMTTNPGEYARLHAAGRIKLDRLPGSGEARLPGT